MSVPAQIEAHANDTTALRTIKAPGWVPGYAYRGTLNILWSCVITLTACVYTVIHLNVPSADESRRRQLMNKVVWAMWAVVCPEMVVYTALSQFRRAKTLVLQLNTEIERQTGVKGKVRVKSFSFCDCYYLVTFTSIPISFTTGCLSVDSFHRIRTRIDDKSKADSIAKALVVGQVCWMAAQCIARAAYGLPIALLEIHTMVHVLCALLIYAVWFRVSCNGIGRACCIGLLSGKKPQDVRQPEIIDSSHALNGIVARMIEAQFTNHNDLAALDEDDSVYGFAQIGLVLLAEGLYSGLHSIAWDHEFPSRVEALLWRMACVAVSAWSVAWGGFIMLDESFNQGDKVVGMGIKWLQNTCGIIFWALIAAAVVARPFIILESFLALRSEPIGVYWIPTWLQMIPHI
ncbi:hypothetical protein B0T26DRAFT_631727 [Lasiosphaeria miniovina]|uniref:Uncharacterized protein n=1 Tax=Lasiosphaeria miniovina TaxID=1954250 RepID=A0AA40BF76_9PEZI|nr:uncharacterized protein B0T26DRAFT_631727 [Lasiosphaeria miniovina]KAK0733104.1 hypothetical protein B0T26DRAFT_631727 [Lasiosphaeria miniovina]